MYNVILFLKNKKAQYALSFFFLILLGVYGYIHATKGIDLTDEGMYVSTAMRFSMGDIPFRDEFMSALSQFNVLLAPVFWIFPEISLLQMRFAGIGLHVVSLFVLFLFLSRYAPPLLVALLCSTMFFVNNFYGIASPSYNSLASAFSLISLALWLFAIVSNNKSRRFFSSLLGGFFFSFAVFSYSSLIIVLVIHGMVIGIAACFFKKPGAYIHSSLVFIGTVGTVIAIVFIIILSCGILPDVIQGFRLATTTTRLGAHGLIVKASALFQQFFTVAENGLIVLAVMGGAVFFFLANERRKKRDDFIYGIVGSIVIAVIGYMFHLLLSQKIQFSVLAFAAPLALLMACFRYEFNETSHENLTWNTVRNIAIAWGFISSLVYGVSSGMGVYACLLGATPLFVFGMVALYRMVRSVAAVQEIGVIRSSVLRAIVITTAITFCIPSMRYYYRSVYNEPEIQKLTEQFQHPRLSGVYSTPKKVRVLEELLGYLKEKLRPGDYFLAYNDIPLLYFLTHTRPAYGAVWARDDWPIAIRRRLVDTMIAKERIPEYCVRMTAFPRGGARNWQRGMPYDEDSPLDAFVRSHYYLETIIHPFEVWHHGQGPALRIFDTMTPEFEDTFINWKGPDTITMRYLSHTAAPLTLQGFKGNFRFSRIKDKDGAIIRVMPVRKGKNGKWVIQCGYTLNKNGFTLTLQPGSKVVFIISARLSNGGKNSPNLFIQDKAETWERNSVIVNTASWEHHIVSKRIRNDVQNICFGINWRPESEKEWLEIRHARIFIMNHEG